MRRASFALFKDNDLLSMTTRLHLLRHAQTTAPSGTLVGATDVGLSEKGMLQARGLAGRLPEGVPCLCSPMRRCRQTLNRLQAEGVASNVVFDERLREMDFGEWEMKTFADIAENGADMDGWMEYHNFTFPGGESVAHFAGRLQKFLVDISTRSDEEVLILTHGGVIRTLLCLTLGLDIKQYLLFNVDFASWNIVELYSEGGVLTALNR